MTQVGVRPPSFVIKTNTDRDLHFSYQRYLENRLREEFGFLGTPIRFAFRKKEKGDVQDEGVAKVRRILDPGEGLKPGRQKEPKATVRTGGRPQRRRDPKAEGMDAPAAMAEGQASAPKAEAPVKKTAPKADPVRKPAPRTGAPVRKPAPKADAPVRKAAAKADAPTGEAPVKRTPKAPAVKKAPPGIHAKGPRQTRRAVGAPRKGKTGPRKGTAPKSGRATARPVRAPKKHN